MSIDRGIGTLDQAVDQEADKMLGNPNTMNPANVGKDLVKALAMQRVKSQLDASQRDINMSLQTPKSTIMEDYEKELIGNTQNEMTNQVEGVMNQKNLRAMGGGNRRPMPTQQSANRGLPNAMAANAAARTQPSVPGVNPMGGNPMGGGLGAAMRNMPVRRAASGGLMRFNKGGDVPEPKNTSRSPNQSEKMLAVAREAVRKLGPSATKEDLQRILQQAGGDPSVKLMLEPFIQQADSTAPSMPNTSVSAMQSDFEQNIAPVDTGDTKPELASGLAPENIRTATDAAGIQNATPISGSPLLGDTTNEKGETQKGVMSTLQDRVGVDPKQERTEERERLQGLYGVAVDPKNPEQVKAREDLLAEPAKQEKALRQAEDDYMLPDAIRRRNMNLYEAGRGSTVALGKLERAKIPQKTALARKNRATNDMNSVLQRVEAAEAGSYQMFRDMTDLQSGALTALGNIAQADTQNQQEFMKIASAVEGSIQSAILKGLEINTTADLQRMIANIKSEQQLQQFYLKFVEIRQKAAIDAFVNKIPDYTTVAQKIASGEAGQGDYAKMEAYNESIKALMYTDATDLHKMFVDGAKRLNTSLDFDTSAITDALNVGTDTDTANQIGINSLIPDSSLSSPSVDNLFNRFDTRQQQQQ